MILETERLILRPWRESDAEDLYEFAKNPLVGPMAGWAEHTSTEYSRQIIRDVLSEKETYAVVIKNIGRAAGSAGLMAGGVSRLGIRKDEAEIGYWIGEPFWGNGYIPEAVSELQRYAFEELNMSALWCGYFDENTKSERVNEKCGFRFHHTEYDVEWPFINAVKTQHITCLKREEWLSDRIRGQDL